MTANLTLAVQIQNINHAVFFSFEGAEKQNRRYVRVLTIAPSLAGFVHYVLKVKYSRRTLALLYLSLGKMRFTASCSPLNTPMTIHN